MTATILRRCLGRRWAGLRRNPRDKPARKTEKAKAESDGQDLLAPLVENAAEAIVELIDGQQDN
jgi:hypothetical protein